MTVKERLELIANSDQSSDHDSIIMQDVLHKIGFNNAIVTLGIVYLDGKGTIGAPPASIHSVAKMLLGK